MFPLSKTWAKLLLGVQLLNGVAAALAAFALKLPPESVTFAHSVNLWIAGVTGGIQAFAKSLADADGDGVPDLFDDTPNGTP